MTLFGVLKCVTDPKREKTTNATTQVIFTNLYFCLWILMYIVMDL